MKKVAHPPVTLDIDLSFSVETEASVVSGTVTASGGEITVFVDSPAAFLAQGVASRRGLGKLSDALARDGVTITVDGPQGTLASVGAVRTSPLSRIVSG